MPKKKKQKNSLNPLLSAYNKYDCMIVNYCAKIGLPTLRYSLAIVFIWFGLLKPLGLSPASGLVANTVFWVDPSWFVPFLGWWEVVIGLCLLSNKLLRLGIALMALQMIGTFLPLVLLPGVVYNHSIGYPPFLTLEGQYIIKNLVLIAAAIVVGSHLRDKDMC